MALENRYSVYPMNEAVLIKSEGTTPVDVLSIPDGTIIDCVLCVIKTPAVVDAGACNLTIGDTDQADDFIPASDAEAAAGTVYGDDPTERGAYLYDATKKGDFRKVYQADKTVKFALSATPNPETEGDTEGEYLIYVFGHRALPLP